MEFVGGVGYTNIDLIYSGMDRLPDTGEEVFAKRFEMHLGGGVPATLINTSRLGVPSKILTFVGNDFFSEFAKKSYAEYGAEIINLYQGSGMPVILTSVMVCNQDRSFTSYREEATASCCTAEDIFLGKTHHPYTTGLFGSLPDLNRETRRLSPIDGLMPDPADLPKGCRFNPRCPHCTALCRECEPELTARGSHAIRCHLMGKEERA